MDTIDIVIEDIKRTESFLESYNKIYADPNREYIGKGGNSYVTKPKDNKPSHLLYAQMMGCL